jgi:2-polyprenyl-6-methoxyphenol hydroxylase-like FAD-dependent oxidoreductase
MPAVKRVAIVGAGVGGTIAAIALRRLGIEAHMIELHDQVLGVGVEFPSNSVRVLDSIGLADECLAAGYGYDKLIACDGEGNVIAETPMPVAAPPQYPAAIAIERPRFAEAIRANALGLGATIQTGVTVSAIHDATDELRLELTDGTVRECDLVIAADGAQSHVREMVFGTVKQQLMGQGAWRIYLRRDPSIESLVLFHHGDRKLVLVPLSDDTMYFGILEPRPSNERVSDADAPGRVLALLEGFTAPAVELLRETVRDGSAYINYRPLSVHVVPAPWYVGRTVLLGDAAHTMCPQIGNGAGMALEDAVVLAEALGKHDDLEPALDEYMERRFDRCKYVVEQSMRLSRYEVEGADPVLSYKVLSDTFSELTKPI